MAYATYTTDALVCGTYDRNTADRSYRLFTRELGMLWADARSVRLEKSKQRMALSDFSLVRVSLVRGKGGWKIGSVVSKQNFYHTAVDQAARGSVVAIIRMLRRFLQGEESQSELFDFVLAALQGAIKNIEHRAFFDQCIFVRCLVLLGYVSPSQLPESVRNAAVEDFTAAYSVAYEQHFTKLLKSAESASQL